MKVRFTSILDLQIKTIINHFPKHPIDSLRKIDPIPWHYFKFIQPCLLELHSTIITNHLSIQLQPQPKLETVLSVAEIQCIAPPASGREPGTKHFLFYPHPLPTESGLSSSPRLCLSPDICFSFLASF